MAKIRERITDALGKTISVDYDKNRLEQELIYYIENWISTKKSNVLPTNLKYFRKQWLVDTARAKRDSSLREMGREINTTGSKPNHAEMQNIVVQMKR